MNPDEEQNVLMTVSERDLIDIEDAAATLEEFGKKGGDLPLLVLSKRMRVILQRGRAAQADTPC